MVTFERPNDKPRWSDSAPGNPARVSRTVEEPVPENISTLFAMGADQFLEFNGVPLRAPAVGALEGAHLYQLQARVHAAQMATQGGGELTAQEGAEYVALLNEIIAACTSLVRPVRRRDKLRRRFGKWEPLRGATARELGLLLGFLLQRQTVSRIRHLEAVRN